jgi:hypothetical protein
MVLNEDFQCLWYEISKGDAIFHDAGGGETLQRQVVHDGDVVEGVGGEEREGTVAGAIGVVHFSAGLEKCLDKLKTNQENLANFTKKTPQISPQNCSCRELKR